MKKLHKVIMPLIECEASLKEQRLVLHQMYAAAVSNAPPNETDNFTAKRMTPVYLALVETLENVRKSQKP